LITTIWFVAGIGGTGGFWFFLGIGNGAGVTATAATTAFAALCAIALHLRNETIGRRLPRSRAENVLWTSAFTIVALAGGYFLLGGLLSGPFRGQGLTPRLPTENSGTSGRIDGSLHLTCDWVAPDRWPSDGRIEVVDVARGMAFRIHTELVAGPLLSYKQAEVDRWAARCQIVNDTMGPLMDVHLALRTSFADAIPNQQNGALLQGPITARRDDELSIPRLDPGIAHPWAFFFRRSCAKEFVDIGWPTDAAATLPSGLSPSTISVHSPQPTLTINPIQGSSCPDNLVPVMQPRQPPFVMPSVDISVDPDVILAGQGATLSWSSTDATDIRIVPQPGSAVPYGQLTVFPAKTTTYTITGTNSTGGTAHKSVTLQVKER
jgi:hypothetical protein